MSELLVTNHLQDYWWQSPNEHLPVLQVWTPDIAAESILGRSVSNKMSRVSIRFCFGIGD